MQTPNYPRNLSKGENDEWLNDAPFDKLRENVTVVKRVEPTDFPCLPAGRHTAAAGR
jgi:hypothetical protein